MFNVKYIELRKPTVPHMIPTVAAISIEYPTYKTIEVSPPNFNLDRMIACRKT